MNYFACFALIILTSAFKNNHETENEINILFITLIVFIIIFFLLFSFAILLRNKMTRMVIEANSARTHISDLNMSVNMLIGESDIVIMRYDFINKTMYRLHNGHYIEILKTLQQLEKNIHPDDFHIYKRDYDRIINGDVDKLISNFRCFEPEKGIYFDYEYVVTVNRDLKNNVTGVLFSRRNETKQKEHIREQKEVIDGLNLALKSGNLSRWQYDIASATIKITDSELREFTLTESDVIKVIHHDDIESVYSHLNKILKGDTSGSLIVRLKQSDYSYKPFEIHSILKYRKDGTPDNINCICVDLSNIIEYRDQLNEKIDLLETITNNMPTGLVYTDKNGKIQEVNDQLIKLIGIRDKSVLKDNYSFNCFNNVRTKRLELLKKGEVIKTEVHFNDIYKSQNYSIDNTVPHEQVFEILCAAIFDKENEIIGYIFLLNGITKAHKYKAQIEQSKQELEIINNKLLKSELRLNTILNKLPIPIYLKDFEQQCYIYVNDEAEKVFNIKAGDSTINNTNANQAIYSRDIESKIIYTGEDYSATEQITLSNGQVMDTFVKKTHLIHSDKDEILVVRMDLTKERQAQFARKILSASFSSFKAFTWIMDTRTGIITYGEDYTEHFESDLLKRDTIKKFSQYIHEDDRVNFITGFNEFSLLDNAQHTFVFRFNSDNSDVFEWWECRAVVETFNDKGEEYKVIYSFNININKQKQTEIELNESKEKAEQSDKLKTAFLANMSHEIRTPLNAIVGFSELIQYSDIQDERDEYMNIINNNNNMLLSLINDILDLSKIESGAIEIIPEKFDIITAINESFASFNTRFIDKGINLRFECSISECVVNLDRKRMLQVLTNYLSNALKYTETGYVVIALIDSGNDIIISVTDTGIGIDSDKQHLVFGRFEKLDSFAQGTGLGLAISKAIVETIGGKVGFTSKKDFGSTFWASFPECIESVVKIEHAI